MAPKGYKISCAFFCKKLKGDDDTHSPPRPAPPGRGRTLTRAPVPEATTTPLLPAHHSSERSSAPCSLLAQTLPTASPSHRPASLPVRWDHIQHRPAEGSEPTAASSESFLCAEAARIEGRSVGKEEPAVTTISRWSWPLTSAGKVLITVFDRLRPVPRRERDMDHL